MAFTINEQKQVFGIMVNSLYCRVLPQVNVGGEIYASPVLYVNREAYDAGQVLRHSFDVLELRQKYSEETGEPLEEYIEIPTTKELSTESIYVGMIENTAQNYLQIVTDKVIDHLVAIGFITDKANAQIETT